MSNDFGRHRGSTQSIFSSAFNIALHLRSICPIQTMDNFKLHNVRTFKDRRQKLCKKLFNAVVSNSDHELHHLPYNLRLKRQRPFDCPASRTHRYILKNCFILSTFYIYINMCVYVCMCDISFVNFTRCN